MKELIYSFRENNVRVVKVEGNPWFVAKDVCDVLEIKNTTQVINRLDEDERAMFNIGRQGEANIVNEFGLYSLILGSRKEEAKEFKRWVTHEVLPSIRKHGMYANEATIDKMIENPDFMLDIINKLKIESERRKAAEGTVAILTHVNKNYTATEVAKECGLSSANRLNKILSEKGVQYYQNGTWILYSKYSTLGYVDIKQDVLDNGKIVYHRKFTQLGREFVVKLLTGGM